MTQARKLSGSKTEPKATTITLKFQLKAGEYTRAARYRVRWLPLFLLILTVPSIVAGQWLAVASELTLAALIIVMPVLAWGSADRVLKDKSEHMFDKDGHTVRSSSQKIHRSWDAFDSYTETKKLFFLRSRGSVAAVVPKRAFASSAEEKKLRVLFASNLSTVPRREEEPVEKSDEEATPSHRRSSRSKQKFEPVPAIDETVSAADTIMGPQVGSA